MQHETFWDFSNRIYQQPEVSNICLQLQNEHGLDVNLLLFACWHAHGRGLFTRRTVKDALHFSSLWSAQVIQPLRHARTWMKHNKTPATDSDMNPLAADFGQLREQIKTLELQCEQFQENMLEGMVQIPPQDQALERQIAAAVYNLRYFITASDLAQNVSIANRLSTLILHALAPSQEQDPALHAAIVSELQR